MAKRINNYSRTTNRKDFKKQKNIEEALDFLEKHGRLKSNTVLMPREINSRCLKYYNLIQLCNNALQSFEYKCLYNKTDLEQNDVKIIIKTIKSRKSIYQGKLINLCSIVIGNVIKKFRTLYPQHYNDTFTNAVLDILIMIDKNKYNPQKASFHSYIYEVSY